MTVTVDDSNLQNIAQAIREKNGTAAQYKPNEMAEAIRAIETGGGGVQPITIDITNTSTEAMTIRWVKLNSSGNFACYDRDVAAGATTTIDTFENSVVLLIRNGSFNPTGSEGVIATVGTEAISGMYVKILYVLASGTITA